MESEWYNGAKLKYNVGDTLTNTTGQQFTVVERIGVGAGSRVKLRFVETGFETEVVASQLSKGDIKDWSIPSVYGVGYYSTLTDVKMSYTREGKKVNTPSYEVWLGILKRCYDTKSAGYKNYGGKGVSVCDEWKDFVKFDKWFRENHSEGLVLDKDILSGGFRGKCYSPQTCTFVPDSVNAFFTNSRRARGLYPVGVCRKTTQSGKSRYIAQVGNLDDRQDYLGRFDTMHEAFMAYKVARENLAKVLAEREYSKGTISKEVYNRLLGWQAVPYP